MSLISNKYKFILYSFPKTGSESVREILNPFADIKCIPCNKSKLTSKNPLYSHIHPKTVVTIFKINKLLPLKYTYDEYFKFCFVRNPWARVWSLYTMIRKNGKYWHLYNNFSNFVNKLEYFSENKDLPTWFRFGASPLEKFIKSDGKILVDHVFKLEDINVEFVDKMKGIGINIDNIPHNNKVNKKYEYRKYYNNKLQKIVENLYQYEIKQYNYVF